MSEAINETPWGRVDEQRTVYVREGDNERIVGSYPDGTPEEALAYFTRKFTDLENQVTLLEARIARGTPVADTVAKLREQLVEPSAVGDLAKLRTRVDTLAQKAQELTETQRAEREAARKEATEKREALILEAERLAAEPEDHIRWKETSHAFEELFTEWKNEQRNSTHISKHREEALWNRFRTARHTFESKRRTHFAKMDANNKEVKQRKERIISAAEALAPKGPDGIPAYRALLDEWKSAGRASRKVDDQLWARFKVAGDVLFDAKAQEIALTNNQHEANLTAKQALLTEAEQILHLTDHLEARKQLTSVQIRWDEIGHVPREAMRETEARLRAIENHVSGLEDDNWRKTNPETKARSEGLRGQLEASITELTNQITAAKTSGDSSALAEAEAKLATQQSWLAAIGD